MKTTEEKNRIRYIVVPIRGSGIVLKLHVSETLPTTSFFSLSLSSVCVSGRLSACVSCGDIIGDRMVSTLSIDPRWRMNLCIFDDGIIVRIQRNTHHRK